MSRRLGSVLALSAFALSGCVSLSGLDAGQSYACKAPDGVTCMSVSGVYASSTRGPVPPAQDPAPSSAVSPAPAQAVEAGAASYAIRSSPRLLRVWIAPWEDSDGDLHEQGYVHMLVNTGRWLIDHARPAPREQMDGVAPPPVQPTPTKAPAAPEAAPLEP